MPLDGFFVRKSKRRAQRAPAEQHVKDLKLFLERVKDYPLDFEEFIDIVRGPYESLEETAIPAESPSFVHGSRHCPLMAPKGKSVARQLLHL